MLLHYYIIALYVYLLIYMILYDIKSAIMSWNRQLYECIFTEKKKLLGPESFERSIYTY
jgi:hypothetical protein